MSSPASVTTINQSVRHLVGEDGDTRLRAILALAGATAEVPIERRHTLADALHLFAALAGDVTLADAAAAYAAALRAEVARETAVG